MSSGKEPWGWGWGVCKDDEKKTEVPVLRVRQQSKHLLTQSPGRAASPGQLTDGGSLAEQKIGEEQKRVQFTGK